MTAQRMIRGIDALLPGLLLVSLAGCGGGGSDGVVGPKAANSGFSATVSGGLSATHTGAAVYIVAPGNGGAFGLTMSARESGASVGITRVGGLLPVPGTYLVANAVEHPEQTLSMMTISYLSGPATGRTFSSTGGTVTITSVGGGHVKGTFSFAARDVNCGCASPASITVTGNFDAVG